MTTIYVSEPIHPHVLDDMASKAELLLGFGPDAVQYASVADRVDAVLLRSERFPAARIVASPRLKVIARHGAGVDTVDVATARERGITVTYCPGGNANAVAEHVFALLLSLGRKVIESHAGLVAGPWPKAKQHLVGQELSGRAMGIVGFGEIGKGVCRIARGFGMEVLVYDPFLAAEVARENQASVVELDELLSRSGVVSLHAPLTPATRHLINADRLSRMRADALLVNTARSGLVDEQALVDALTHGKIAGAAVDVAEAEHTAAGPVLFGGRALADVPNLLMTPHIGGQTSQSLLNVGATAWNDIEAVIAGRTPRYPVGLPASRS
jgi:phosphoglycerate dehydrogenase-like enzyme